MNELESHIQQIKHLCAIHDVKSLFAFGSVLNDALKTDSDIDLIVDIDSANPLDYTDNYFAIKFELQELLKRPIDLLEDKAVKNPILKQQIDNTKVLIYGR